MDWTKSLAIVSDEAAPRFGDAVAHCLPLGIRAYELRNLDGRRVPYVSEEQIAEVQRLSVEHGLQLLGLSPGLAKGAVDDPASARELTTDLDAALRLGQRLDVPRLTLFTFKRTSREAPIPQHALDALGGAVARCRAADIEPLLENSAASWGDTGAHVAELAAALDVGITWDPANAAASGELAFPEGYAAVRDHVAHLHVKAWHPQGGHVHLGQGVVDWPGQLAALQADGYQGRFCIESHRWDDPTATRVATRQLLAWLRDLKT